MAQKKKAFRVLPKAAPHYVNMGVNSEKVKVPDVRVNPGGVVLSHDNLIDKFPNKFERAPEHDEKEEPAQEAPSTATFPVDDGAEDNANRSEAQDASKVPAPIDVTNEFPKAEKSGLKVFKHRDKKLYAILDGEDPLPDATELESKNAVNRVLDAYVKS